MEPLFPQIFTRRHLLGIILVILLIADIIGFTEYRSQALLGDLPAKLQAEKIEKEGLESRIGNLELALQTIKSENEALLGQATDIQQDIQNELGDISDTVGALDKLSKTDPELLQKYSKSYFLNEHYVPTELTGINPVFTFVQDKILKIHVDVSPYLEKLFNDAKAEGLNLGVVSAYRTFSDQSVLKSTYKFTYGAGTANQFSAEQGYSEHQLGTTVDFATTATAETWAGFNQTPEYVWLMNNAQKYGFVLSYPQNNSYYQYEPWHWRFVGVTLARRLYKESKYFYEFDQREINTYLANIFD